MKTRKSSRKNSDKSSDACAVGKKRKKYVIDEPPSITEVHAMKTRKSSRKYFVKSIDTCAVEKKMGKYEFGEPPSRTRQNPKDLFLSVSEHFKVIDVPFNGIEVGKLLEKMVYAGEESPELASVYNPKHDESHQKIYIIGIHHADGHNIPVDTEFRYLEWEPINFKKHHKSKSRRFQREICRYCETAEGVRWEGILLPELNVFLESLRNIYPYHYIIVKELMSIGAPPQHIHCDGVGIESISILTGLYPDGSCRILRPHLDSNWNQSKDSGLCDAYDIGVGQAFLWDGLWAHSGAPSDGLHRRLFVWLVHQDHYPMYDVIIESNDFV